MNEKKQDLPEKIKAVKSDSPMRSFDPKKTEDYTKLSKLQVKCFEILDENDLPFGAVRGLYLAGTQMGGLELRADHDPGVELPEEINDILNDVEVELIE